MSMWTQFLGERYLSWTGGLLLMVFVWQCSHKAEKKTENKASFANGRNNTLVTLTDAQLKNAGIDTGHAVDRDVEKTLKVTGSIDVPPHNMASVTFPMGGRLKSTQLLPGMHVKKGQPIALMEDEQYIQLQQDYLTAKATLNYSQKDYLRQRDLNESKANSDKVFQKAQADYESAKITVSSLAEKLRLLGINLMKLNDANISRTVSVYAPIAGYVSKVLVNIGKYVTPSDVLFEIVDPSDIHLALDVFEKDVSLLHKEQKVIAYTNSAPDKKYLCEVVLVGKDLSDQRKTEVHCHFIHEEQGLLPGTFMNAEIIVRSGKELTLPEAAIVRYGNKSYAFRVKNPTTFQMIEVNAGDTKNGFVGVSNASVDLNGVSLVTQGAYTLLMKMKNTSEDE